ncbi:MAG: DUF4861 family protein [Pseudomonadota bacterium]
MLMRLPLLALLAAPLAQADQLNINVTHELALARPSETITVPWSQVNKVLPGAMIQHIAVKDGAGRVLPHQVTNIAPLVKDPLKVGAAYGELIFQYSFAPGEKKASFTVTKTETLAPVFASQAFARYVPERLDDFAWENDKVAHRTYGTALGAPAAPGVVKEVLASSGIDIWFKRVPYPIVDRWYNKGHDHYHVDQGEGMDMYNVGKSRGCGGTGVWDGATLFASHNYARWKMLANGPVRAIFELSYDAWDAGGVQVTEVKRFTIDAGHYLDQIDSTFTFAGPEQLTVAVGLNKTPTDKGQTPKLSLSRTGQSQIQWVEQTRNGEFGTAVIVPSASGFADDPLNHLVLARVRSGQALRYHAGAAWNRSGDIADSAQWHAYVAAAAQRIASPLTITIAEAK